MGRRQISANSPPLETSIPLVPLTQALAVAEYLSFRHAASALGVCQSSVNVWIPIRRKEALCEGGR